MISVSEILDCTVNRDTLYSTAKTREADYKALRRAHTPFRGNSGEQMDMIFPGALMTVLHSVTHSRVISDDMKNITAEARLDSVSPRDTSRLDPATRQQLKVRMEPVQPVI
ncbi:MAG: hypothetical protein MZV63_60955 [Marinilabiliales bacterium]|nr:hypothetical protein [Marinilabiliales bacterium]